jgi:molybdopterin/thiamine biosynthesis adenylyltransferase
MTRYQRQIQLSDIGEMGQAKLREARVVVIGAGGLGHPVASYLAGAGIGHITIVDHDVIELTNLHRQVQFTEADIGQPKAETLMNACRQLNAEIEICGTNERLTPDNVAALCAEANLVIDAADSFAVTYILSDFCKAESLPLISASVLGFEGYVGG